MLTWLDRIGLALVSPRSALAAADAQKGGSPDVAILLALKVVCTQFPALFQIGWQTWAQGLGVGLPALLREIAAAISVDLFLLLGAGLLLTVVAGKKRSASRDFDLAAVAWLPYFAVTLLGTLLAALFDTRAPWFATLVHTIGVVWMLGWLVLAYLHTRTRTTRPAAPADGAAS